MDFNLSKSLPQSVKTTAASSSRNGMLEIVLLVIVGAVFAWFLIMPKYAAWQTDLVSLDSLKKKDQDIQINKKQIQSLVAQLKTKAPLIAQMDEALPLDNRVTKLYIVLQRLADESGMTVGDISIAYKNDTPISGNVALLANPYKVKRSVQKFTTALNVIGTYSQFESLLTKLETSGRLINITSIDMTSSKGDQIQFTLNLESYYYGQSS